MLGSALQMSYITGVTASQILWRGQAVKVQTLFLEEAHKQNYIVEDMQDAAGDDPEQEGSPHKKTEGATVLEPRAGMYVDPVLCLDFASLYPSLMRTFN